MHRNHSQIISQNAVAILGTLDFKIFAGKNAPTSMDYLSINKCPKGSRIWKSISKRAHGQESLTIPQILNLNSQ
jgi:hypothetical protein